MKYQYEIVELSPADWPDFYTRTVITRDTLDGAEKVLHVLETTDVNYTVYAILLRPVLVK